MGIINYIEFGGVKSSDYGIYVSGEGTFNAPERDVELIEIPGRNGDFSLDKGRFKNITVTYPVFNYETNLTDFRTRLSDFRNALKSKIGYQRLEDTFHPDEYRMATFIDVFEVQPVMYNTASTIELTFNCKPQRFLKSGEIPQAIGEWGETETITGDIATFEAESNTAIKSLAVDIEPVQSGSGDPSPTNVRPISGWSGANVEQKGKNLVDESVLLEAEGWTESNGVYSGQAYAINARFNNNGSLADFGKGIGQITYSLEAKADIRTPMYLKFVYDDGSGEFAYKYIETTWSKLTWTSVSGKSVKEIKLSYGAPSTWELKNLQVELGTTATAYEPYQGESYSIPFKDENGNPITVYGGNINITEGEGSNEMGMVDMGTLRWVYNPSYLNRPTFVANAPTGILTGDWQNQKIVCECFKVTKTMFQASADDCIIAQAANGQLYAHYYQFDNVTDFKNAMNGLYLAYPLANPTPIYCEPEQIQTLVGVNNIWADSGEVSVEYGADPNILVNPTPFESQPLLEFAGLGDININDDVITVHDSAMGKVLLANKTARGDNPDIQTESRFNSGNYSLLENGDLIRVEDGSTMYAIMSHPQASVLFDSFSASVTGGTIGATVIVTDESTGTYNVVLEPFNYTKGTFLVHTVEVSVSFSITINGAVTSWDGVITYRYEYDPSFIPRVYYGLSTSPDLPSGFNNAMTRQSYLATIYGYSTRTGGGVQYIDLGIGEAYIMTDGVPVSINNIVSIPARLPELKSGDNHITHDNTITSLKVTPRWWKI